MSRIGSKNTTTPKSMADVLKSNAVNCKKIKNLLKKKETVAILASANTSCQRAYLCGTQAETIQIAIHLFTSFFQVTHLFCRTAEQGLSKLLFNSNLVEGRPSLVSDLNIVAAILAG